MKKYFDDCIDGLEHYIDMVKLCLKDNNTYIAHRYAERIQQYGKLLEKLLSEEPENTQ